MQLPQSTRGSHNQKFRQKACRTEPSALMAHSFFFEPRKDPHLMASPTSTLKQLESIEARRTRSPLTSGTPHTTTPRAMQRAKRTTCWRAADARSTSVDAPTAGTLACAGLTKHIELRRRRQVWRELTMKASANTPEHQQAPRTKATISAIALYQLQRVVSSRAVSAAVGSRAALAAEQYQ